MNSALAPSQESEGLARTQQAASPHRREGTRLALETCPEAKSCIFPCFYSQKHLIRGLWMFRVFSVCECVCGGWEEEEEEGNSAPGTQGSLDGSGTHP